MFRCSVGIDSDFDPYSFKEIWDRIIKDQFRWGGRKNGEQKG